MGVKKRGRPPKKTITEAEIKAEEIVATAEPALVEVPSISPPPKKKSSPVREDVQAELEPKAAPQKRRGRPPKKAIIAELEAAAAAAFEEMNQPEIEHEVNEVITGNRQQEDIVKPQRKRGRPKKVADDTADD